MKDLVKSLVLIPLLFMIGCTLNVVDKRISPDLIDANFKALAEAQIQIAREVKVLKEESKK